MTISGKQERRQETLHQGQFPSSSKNLPKECRTLSLSIFGSEDFGKFEPCKLDRIKIASIANVSWAILLRRYIGTNRVSFGLLTNGKATNEDINHYSLSNHQRLDEICAIDKRRASEIQYSHIDINTAVEYAPNPMVVHDVAASGQRSEQLELLRKVRLCPKYFTALPVCYEK